jgi:Zn-dependent protease with chaperone function
VWQVTLALCVHTVIAAVCIPRLLRVGPWILAHPGSALLAWVVGFVSSGLALVAAGVIGFVELSTWHDSSAPWPQYAAMELLPWVPVVAFIAALALVSARAERMFSQSHRSRRDVEALVRAFGVETYPFEGHVVSVVDSPLPVAFSLPGRPARIVVSTALRAELEPDEVTAVLRHECAHLTGRHHVATRLADLAVACSPWVPASRQFKQSTSLLVELIADDEACMACSRTTVAQALAKFGTASFSDALALRARRLSGELTSGAATTSAPAPSS